MNETGVKSSGGSKTPLISDRRLVGIWAPNESNAPINNPDAIGGDPEDHLGWKKVKYGWPVPPTYLVAQSGTLRTTNRRVFGFHSQTQAR
jgi:hypothetical protein